MCPLISRTQDFEVVQLVLSPSVYLFSVIDKKTLEFYNATAKDLDGIVNQLRITKGIECAIFMYATGNLEYKVSLRSCKYVDVSKIAAFFGGGGHMRAAGLYDQWNFL